jgi:uracil phosphoribosyltransferase
MRQNTADCPSRLFVRLMKEIGMVMALAVIGKIYQTQKSPKIAENGKAFEGQVLSGKKPVIVPILRSGLLMAEGMQEIISTTFTGHIGIYHDLNGPPVKYLSALPALTNPDQSESQARGYFFLVDPVIATGGTACLAIQTLKEYNVPSDKIIFVSLIVGEEGQRELDAQHSDIRVFSVIKNMKMDGRHIISGLGSCKFLRYDGLFRHNAC